MALRKKKGEAADTETPANKNVAKKRAQKKAADATPPETPATPRKRGENVDYGYLPGAKISVNKEKTYRGRRGEVFEILKTCHGKTVETFEAAAKKVLGDDPARGWLRFYCLDEACELSGGKAE